MWWWWWWWRADCRYKCSCTIFPAEFGPYICFWMSRPQSIKNQKQHSYNFFPPSISASSHCTYTQMFLFFFSCLTSLLWMCVWGLGGRYSSASNTVYIIPVLNGPLGFGAQESVLFPLVLFPHGVDRSLIGSDWNIKSMMRVVMVTLHFFKWIF